MPQKADLWYTDWYLTGRQCAKIRSVLPGRDAGIKVYQVAEKVTYISAFLPGLM